ncbi:NAD(P)/FAD-dependent oxidoreductase [Candidatus Phycosocius spiralis]|uniref:NAD(FAD)-utilizing dehydrogenase n=1 Tax=Candidatus Phycosocius spiralis TaxID=2815099 RepID=A0ABQ4PXK4_9PROT|nr:TIGR03862 family flavoprotein [Candidatus Phycosocius spiralis]GIU67748.1 NAD(FAD)-utilizing dehydrogenase [Candidatus Phycosocius spiralis]
MAEASQLPIIIIGAGPSGLFASDFLASKGHRVVVFEAMTSVGRKFLMAGRGGLNLTHSEELGVFKTRYGAASTWTGQWLDQFTPADLQAWANGLDQELFVGSSGRIFPKAFKASPLLRAWLRRLETLEVKIITGARWIGFSKAGEVQIRDRDGNVTSHASRATLLALGGASWPKLGSDGVWTTILAPMGVEITPLQASNCGIHLGWNAYVSGQFGGAILKNVAISCGHTKARGDVVITQMGLEGGPIYALSGWLREVLAAGPCSIEIDLRPDQSPEALATKLVRAKAGQSLSTALKSHLRMTSPAIALMREATQNKLPNSAMGLARLIKTLPLKVTGLAGLERAISTAGGVAQASVDHHLMLKKVPGVFVAGEMLDWDAPTGGYLLQACFSSAALAAKGIDDWIVKSAS